MCSRILLSVLSGLAGFSASWALLTTALVGEAYVSVLVITPLAAGFGLVIAGAMLIATAPRRTAQAPQAKPARRLTDAHVQLAMADPPAPPPPTRPQPQTVPEDHADAWLRLDSRRKVWPPADRPAGDAIACYIKGRRAVKYTAEDGSQHVMYVDQVRR